MSISVDGLSLAVSYSEDANTILSGLIAGAALAIGWVTGAVRPTRISGPVRLPDDAPLVPFASILFGSFGLFVLAASALMKAGSADPGTPTELQTALVACIPPIVGLAAIWIGDRAILPLASQKLGTSARLISRGVAIGLLASLIVLPVLFFASEVAEFVYKLASYQHELEHPLLRAMGESPSLIVRAAMVIGACIIVPIWEEAFFRGHLQTLLRSAFGWMLSGPSTQRSFQRPDHAEPVSTSTGTDRPTTLQYETPPQRVLHYKNTAAWMAVIVTSAMFAILHPLWTAPIIFLLALCLGYAYERTGNLWVCIAMHAAFNSISTFWYLAHGAN